MGTPPFSAADVVVRASGVGCVACGRSATALLCDDCMAVARSSYADLAPGADRSGYDAAVFEELAELEPTSFWFRGRSRVICWALERYFPSACSFLEVGCGTGYTLSALSAAAPRLQLAGGDVHPEGLSVARRRLPAIPLYCLDARTLPFDAAFDVVGAFDVVEHIPEDEQALSALARATRPGGGVLLTVPQHPWLWSPVDEAAHYQRRYSRRELMRKIRGAGLEVQRVTSFMSLLLPAMALTRKRAASAASYDFRSEFGLPRALDRALEAVVSLERALLRAGVSFPAGGSLLVVARRPR